MYNVGKRKRGLTSAGKHRSRRLEWPSYRGKKSYQRGVCVDYRPTTCFRPSWRTFTIPYSVKFTQVPPPELRPPSTPLPRSRELKAHEYGKNANPSPGFCLRRICVHAAICIGRTRGKHDEKHGEYPRVSDSPCRYVSFLGSVTSCYARTRGRGGGWGWGEVNYKPELRTFQRDDASDPCYRETG